MVARVLFARVLTRRVAFSHNHRQQEAVQLVVLLLFTRFGVWVVGLIFLRAASRVGELFYYGLLCLNDR